MQADIAIIDLAAYRDRATYENPHQFAEGVAHVLVNGLFAIRDGQLTGTTAGIPIARP